MPEDPESFTMPEVVRLIKRLEASLTTGLQGIKDDIARVEQNYVTRGEWEIYREHVENELKRSELTHRKDIEELKARGHAWVPIVAILISGLVGVVTIIRAILPS